jgi:hypothetical protein
MPKPTAGCSANGEKNNAPLAHQRTQVSCGVTLCPARIWLGLLDPEDESATMNTHITYKLKYKARQMRQISPVNIRFSPAGQNLVYSPQREKPGLPLFNKHNKNNNGIKSWQGAGKNASQSRVTV